jgi:hypothetical protein
MDDLSLFCCQNAGCPDYGERGQGNLRVCFRYGVRKGTALQGCRLPQERALAVLGHLQGTRPVNHVRANSHSLWA